MQKKIFKWIKFITIYIGIIGIFTNLIMCILNILTDNELPLFEIQLLINLLLISIFKNKISNFIHDSDNKYYFTRKCKYICI